MDMLWMNESGDYIINLRDSSRKLWMGEGIEIL